MGVVTGRNEERAKEVVDKIKADGGEAIYVIADTSDLDSSQKIFDATMQAYGTVDILFNNAGVLSTTPLTELTLDEWQKVMNVNVTSPMLLTKLCADELTKNHGHIVNTASVAGCAAKWGPVAYCTSKHAMMGLTKAMANELRGIHVNGICPGAIKTAMLDGSGADDVIEFMRTAAPVGRIGAPEEIATPVLFLCTDESSFIDGQLIRVDGGVDC